MSRCTGIAYGDAFVASALNAADCQARAIASLGYQALATPGSSASLVLTGLLTLFVALWGYRLMMGEAPGMRDGVLALVKIGIVLALATSWSTYRTLAHDVVLTGPAELVTEVGTAAGLPGSNGDLALRLQYVDRGLAQLGELGVGKRESDRQVMRVRNINGRNEMVVQNQEEGVGVIEPVSLGLARVLFLVSAVGGLVVLRLVAAILLALGPLFVVFLLFDTTRGWFAGWLRGLAATMIGMFGVGILLGVELALLESWVAGLLARRASEQTIAGAPVELMAATAIFALATLGALAAAARVASGFRFPEAWRAMPDRLTSEFERLVRSRETTPAASGEAAIDRSRATAVADAVMATQRREMAAGAAVAGGGNRIMLASDRAAVAQGTTRDLHARSAPPLGQSHGRRARNRVSVSAGRRDMR